MVDRCFFVTVR